MKRMRTLAMITIMVNTTQPRKEVLIVYDEQTAKSPPCSFQHRMRSSRGKTGSRGRESRATQKWRAECCTGSSDEITAV